MIKCYIDQASYSKPGGQSHGIFNQEKIVGEDYEDVPRQIFFPL